jgi:DNA-binding FadR family transcriptional regulator
MQTRSFRNGRLSELVLHQVQRLVGEEYPTPGSRLPNEAELAERFHVSRTVVREAMKILEDRGFVEVRSGRGTLTVAAKSCRVKESLLRLFQDQPIPTIEETESLLELRQVLEETAARLAAVRATAEDLEEIESALGAMKEGEACELDDAVAADLRFHRGVVRAAHNHYLEMVLDPLTDVFLQQIKLTDGFSTRCELHRNIFVKICSRNPVGARQAVRRLMKVTLADCRTTLKNFV